MRSGDHPFHTLERLVSERATGELVCALADAEVHVHLQAGRVAWATTSCARFAFTGYLMDKCGLDRAALRELIEECRRERRPLGELLIEWGLATREQVQEALREQVLDALTSLRDAQEPETVFLQRGASYQRYNAEFTFCFDGLADELRARHGIRRASTPALSVLPAAPDLSQRLGELVASEADVRWAVHKKGAAGCVSYPTGSPTPAILGLTDGVLTDLELIALRGDAESVIGLPLSDPEESVWCGLHPASVLGVVLTVVRETLGMRQVSPRFESSPPSRDIEVHADRGVSQDVLRELMERTPTLLGVGLVDQGAESHWLAERHAVEAAGALSQVTELSRLLRGARDLPGALVSASRASMVARTPSTWVFGGELLDHSNRDLWLVVDGNATQGLGWALLTALLRRTSLTAREVRS